MDRREFVAGVAGASVLPVAAIASEDAKPDKEEPKELVWKVINIEAGQKEPEKVQQILNDLESKGYAIVGVEPCTGNQVQVYARIRPNFMFSDSIARS